MSHRLLVLLFLFALQSSPISGIGIFRRNIDQNSTLIYVYENVGVPFDQAVKWCNGLGGHLPTIHSNDDVNFLVNNVMGGKNSYGKNGMCITWLNMKRFGHKDCRWLDGSLWDFRMTWWDDHEECFDCGTPCCAAALDAWDVPKYPRYKKAASWQCDGIANQACVIQASPQTITSTLYAIANKVKGKELTPQEFRWFLMEVDPVSHSAYSVLESQMSDVDHQFKFLKELSVASSNELRKEMEKLKVHLQQDINEVRDSLKRLREGLSRIGNDPYLLTKSPTKMVDGKTIENEIQ